MPLEWAGNRLGLTPGPLLGLCLLCFSGEAFGQGWEASAGHGKAKDPDARDPRVLFDLDDQGFHLEQRFDLSDAAAQEDRRMHGAGAQQALVGIRGGRFRSWPARASR